MDYSKTSNLSQAGFPGIKLSQPEETGLERARVGSAIKSHSSNLKQPGKMKAFTFKRG
jgi:hypothetical protein